MFVMQYQENLCIQQVYMKNRPCKGIYVSKKKFSVHGLWPQNRTFTNGCPKESHDNHNLLSLSKDLKYYWPSILLGKDEDFWGYEWTEHGGCSSILLEKEADYFMFGLDIAKKLEPKLLIEGKGDQVTIQSVKTEILQQTGFEPAIRCSTANGKKDLLIEISFCVKNSLPAALVDCASYGVKDRCQPNAGLITF